MLEVTRFGGRLIAVGVCVGRYLRRSNACSWEIDERKNVGIYLPIYLSRRRAQKLTDSNKLICQEVDWGGGEAALPTAGGK